MGHRSPFKQGFLGGTIAIITAVLLYAAGFAAVRLFNPQDATDDVAQSQLVAPSISDVAISSATISPVLRVFQTIATYNGSGPAGYGRSAMHAACRQEDPGSHFCSLQEVENAWKTGGVNILLTGQAWVDNAVVGTINSGYSGDFTLVSDWYGGNEVGDYPYNCNAWTVSANTNRGLILNSGAISPATEACDDIHPISCCKRVFTYWLHLPVIMR